VNGTSLIAIALALSLGSAAAKDKDKSAEGGKHDEVSREHGVGRFVAHDRAAVRDYYAEAARGGIARRA
jgi:hypothetical protein